MHIILVQSVRFMEEETEAQRGGAISLLQLVLVEGEVPSIPPALLAWHY